MDGGAWREFVAERCPLAWQLAQRLTREEREGLPLTPRSHPGYGQAFLYRLMGTATLAESP